MLESSPDSVEAMYLLGVCERARGRTEAAISAWSRIAPDSRLGAMAILARATAEVDRGRLAEAERLIEQALGDSRIDGLGLRRFLAPLYWQEGRVDEAKQLIEANWHALDRSGQGDSEQAIELVRLHVALSVGMASIEAVRDFLNRAAALAPDDDRIALARANLAMRQGHFDEAATWLAWCDKKRPRDPVIWRARLDLAVAAGKVDEARDALAHIPVERSTAEETARLAAWFAAKRRDHAAERAALERLIRVNPEDGVALDRLVELLIGQGQPDQAATTRGQKSELASIKSQYQELFRRDQPTRDAAAMAVLAERLGRVFEARAFATIALKLEPTRRDLQEMLARLGRPATPAGRPGQTLADVVDPEHRGAAVSAHAGAGPPPGRATTGLTVRFQDDAERAGLDHVFMNGQSSVHQIPEVSSGGVGLIDFDGDGWLDVYAIQGGPFPPPESATSPGDRLFRNRHDGTFEDATERAGLPLQSRGYGHGVAVGDYDNDGHADLFVTRWRSYGLYRNRGDGRFDDVTRRSGLGGDRDWPTSAAWADLDNDGDLDLYVCHYLEWDAAHPRICRDPARASPISCDPRSSHALSDHVFRNDQGRFVDVTAQSGCMEREGRGFGVVAVDIDDDNRIDLFVANDMSANYLWRNLGNYQFRDQGLLAGIACNAGGGHQAGMGVAAGDLDADGRVDLAVTNFYNESTSLFHNLGQGQFVDHTSAAGIAVATRDLLGFGVAFLDADNDGWIDLITANGHVNDYRPAIPYQMCAQLLRGGPGGRMADISAQSGAPFLVPHLGRGLAVGDLDNDGRVDAVLVAHNEPLVYLHNQTAGGHFLTIALEGKSSNRDGVGARITIEAAGARQVAQRQGGGSFLSASDPRVHFGLGESTRVDRLEIRWPSGRVDQYRGLAADHAYRIREADPTPTVLTGW